MSLLDHFWGLASDDLDARISAGEALLKGLQEKQSEEDWNYALKRLVRGLSSSRGSARLGFSMALAELLQQRADHMSVKQYLDLCNESFEISGNMKGNEERGLLFGRLFALEILARSSLWENKSTGSADLIAFVEMTVALALRKAWLREPPFLALCELVRRLSQAEKYNDGIAFAFKHVSEKGLTMSCEGVALALAVNSEQRAKFNAGTGWESGDPMDKRNVSALVRALRETPVSSGDVSQTKPYVHFVWSYLLAEFVKNGAGSATAGNSSEEPPAKKRKSEKKAKKSNANRNTVSLAEFWKSAVDRDFFGPDKSSERKMWGFEIFLLWSQESSLREIVHLFSPNFVKTLSLHSAQKDRHLNKMAKKVVNVITQEIVPKRQGELIPIISQFMTQSPNFDKLSKTKLVHQLLTAVDDEESIAKLVDLLLQEMRASSHEDLVRKQWIFDNLVQLVRNVSNSSSTPSTNGSNAAHHGATSCPWISDIFRELIPLAYFVNTKETKETEEGSENSQEQVAKMAQDRVMSILSSTLGKSVQSVNQDPQSSWPYIVFQLILNMKEERPEYEPRVEFDSETSKAVAKAEHTLHKIHKKRNSSRHVDSSQLQAFELLFAMVILQVYGSIPDAVSMLDELQMCYNKINGKMRAYEDGEGSDTEADDEPPMVLTEILISLLSQQSVVLRKLSEDVWRTFSSQFSESSLTLLCDILAAQEGTDGQRSLFDVENDSDEEEEDDEDDDDEEEEEEEEEDDDEGATGDGSVSNEKPNKHEFAVVDGSNENSDGDSDYELDEATKAKLAGALGVNPTGADGSDNSSSSDEDSMDDEQMSALDVHLATIFKERRKIQTKAKEQRRENSRAKQNVVQLKGRVLDLLDIYYSAQPEKLVGLACIEPMLKFIATTKEARLAEKAREVIRTRVCRKTSYVLSSEEDIMHCLELMKRVHTVAAESKSKILSLSCNQVSVFLAKLVIAFDPALISAVASIYNSSMQTWFLNPDNQTMGNMFIDFVNFLETKRKP